MLIIKQKKELDEIILGKKLYLFGAGNIASKTIERYKLNPILIADNNKDTWSTKQCDVPIVCPESLSNQDDVVWLICSTSFKEIEAQLIESKVNPKMIILSPLLNQIEHIADFESLKFDILFTSGNQSRIPNNLGGGGLYRIKGRFDNYKLDKIIEGPCHGLIKHKNNIVVVSEDQGLCVLNKNLNLISKSNLKSSLRPHGISYSPEDDLFALACSYGDCLLLLDNNFEEKDIICLSKGKSTHNNMPQHHCNDVFCKDGMAFVSMFSVTGNWKRGIFDGGLISINIKSRKVVDKINLDLLMPHNITLYNDDLMILDSLRGRVLTNGFQVLTELNGFTRGFDVDKNGNLIIGQSKNRNYSRINQNKLNISLDNSLIVMDPLNKISKTLLMPSNISEIHSVLSIY